MKALDLLRTCLLGILVGIACGGDVWSQEPSPVEATPLVVELVFSNYDGEEVSERLSYRLLVNAEADGQATELRMGIEAPVTNTDGKVQYRNVGTNITCRAQPAPNGRFLLNIQVERSSFVSEATPRNSPLDNPLFRSRSGKHRVLLRDQETIELSSSTDPINGQQSTVEVTIRAAGQ